MTKKSDKPEKKDIKDSKKDGKEKSEDVAGGSQDPTKKNEERKRPGKSPGQMVVIDQTKGDQLYMRPQMRRGRFDKMRNNRERFFQNKMKFRDKKDILTFEKMKAQRLRENVERLQRLQRYHRAVELRRRRDMAERERRERERVRIMREREELDHLQRERERLEIERQKLERERMERERLERERIRIEQERRKEAERIAREREELRRQQEQLRFEQDKRNSLKRPRDVDQRRDDPFWNENKKMAMDTDSRFSQGSDYNRQQNRFNDFDHRERGRYPDSASSFDRRDRFVPPEGKKGFNKNFGDSRRNDAAQPRNEPRDTDRRDRDERRPVGMERAGGNRPEGQSHERARMSNPDMQHGRHQRDPPGNPPRTASWKEGGMPPDKRDTRPGRDGPGHSSRGGHGSRGGKSGYSGRDGDRPVMAGDRGSGQHYNEGRHMAPGRDNTGPRKEWHGPNVQGSGFDNRRMPDGRSGGMMSSHSSNSAINRVVPMPGGPMQRGSGSGFKPFKGAPQRRY